MSLRPQGPQALVRRRRDRQIRDAEARLEEAVSKAMRSTLRRAQQSVQLESLTAAAQRTVRMFSANESMRWWEEAVDRDVRSAVESVWRAGYFDTRDGSMTEAARRSLSEFTDGVRRQLTESPGAPGQRVYERAREALDADVRAGRGLDDAVGRVKAELGWNEPKSFWQGRLDEADRAIDAVLDPIGPPGHPSREAARRSDPQVRKFQQQRAEAVRHTDRVKSTWQVQSEATARTYGADSFTVGTQRAATDEGAGVKVWIATADEATRDTHLDATGQCTSVDDFFEVGADMLDHPADVNGSPEETFNCRCTLVYASTCEEADQLYGDVYSVIDDEKQRRSDAQSDET